MDRVVGQTDMAIATRNLTRQHSAGRTVGIVDFGFDADFRGTLEARLRFRDDPAIENFGEPMILARRVIDRLRTRSRRLMEKLGEIESLRLRMFDELAFV